MRKAIVQPPRVTASWKTEGNPAPASEAVDENAFLRMREENGDH